MNRACDERPTGLGKIYRKKMFFYEILICLKKRFALHKRYMQILMRHNTQKINCLISFSIYLFRSWINIIVYHVNQSKTKTYCLFLLTIRYIHFSLHLCAINRYCISKKVLLLRLNGLNFLHCSYLTISRYVLIYMLRTTYFFPIL